jgi:hypothetical protein
MRHNLFYINLNIINLYTDQLLWMMNYIDLHRSTSADLESAIEDTHVNRVLHIPAKEAVKGIDLILEEKLHS